MRNKVMIIVCYFGVFPEWTKLWLLSCEKNQLFDFMVVSDSFDKKYDYPKNVKKLELSIEELRQRFSAVLGFEAVLSHPYKLCDYKPVYGLAFEKELSDYDFWGHCDIDLIWGDLSKFINDELLDKYDRIGGYGHLVLYRNIDVINKLFMKQGAAFPYNIVLKDDTHYGFDEMTGINRIFDKQGIDYYTELPIVDANRFLTRISAFPLVEKNEIYFWREGRIFRVYKKGKYKYKMSEYAYLHFQKKCPVYYCGKNYKNGFYIKSTEFKPMQDVFDLKKVQTERECRCKFYDGIDLLRGWGKRILDLLFYRNLHEKKILLKKGTCYMFDQLKKLYFS